MLGLASSLCLQNYLAMSQDNKISDPKSKNRPHLLGAYTVLGQLGHKTLKTQPIFTFNMGLESVCMLLY